MKATVDKSGCISCGLCVSTCPAVFEMDDDNKAGVICDPVPADAEPDVVEARDGCPVSVISVEE